MATLKVESVLKSVNGNVYKKLLNVGIYRCSIAEYMLLLNAFFAFGEFLYELQFRTPFWNLVFLCTKFTSRALRHSPKKGFKICSFLIFFLFSP